MTDIIKIREAVKVLSTITDSEWEEIEKIISNLSNPIEEPKAETKVLSDSEKEKKVRELIKRVGIPSSIKGYKYVISGIFWVMNNSEDFSITKELYPDIAKEFNTTSSRVERAIRHAIEIAWDRGDTKIHNDIFGYALDAERGKPCNKDALVTLAEYLKLYML